jgi:hypothetical protein
MKNNRLKKLLLLVIFSLLFFAFACKEEVIETSIMTIASKRPEPVSPGFEVQPTYWVKFQGESQWIMIVEEIREFDYTEGYEYVVEVNKEVNKEFIEIGPHGDALSDHYVLLRIISKEKKESDL